MLLTHLKCTLTNPNELHASTFTQEPRAMLFSSGSATKPALPTCHAFAAAKEGPDLLVGLFDGSGVGAGSLGPVWGFLTGEDATTELFAAFQCSGAALGRLVRACVSQQIKELFSSKDTAYDCQCPHPAHTCPHKQHTQSSPCSCPSLLPWPCPTSTVELLSLRAQLKLSPNITKPAITATVAPEAEQEGVRCTGVTWIPKTDAGMFAVASSSGCIYLYKKVWLS